MNGSTIQVTFAKDSAEGLALTTVRSPDGPSSVAVVVEGGPDIVANGGVVSSVSWQKDLDAAYTAAAADTGWVADRLEFGALIEEAYEVDDDGAG
jgi:hypothetical protein